MTDKMREAFEKWATENEYSTKMYDSFHDDYYDDTTQSAWRAWQAAQSYCPSPDPVKLAELGWQMIECPICGGGAQAFPQQAAQSVPVVGEPTDAAYKWMIANGVEPLTSLHKLGERLAALLDEDQFSECEALLLTAITAINTFVPVPAAELATLREKAAEADELQKRAERMQKALSDIAEWTDRYTTPGHPVSTIASAAIAQGKGG